MNRTCIAACESNSPRMQQAPFLGHKKKAGLLLFLLEEILGFKDF